MRNFCCVRKELVFNCKDAFLNFCRLYFMVFMFFSATVLISTNLNASMFHDYNTNGLKIDYFDDYMREYSGKCLIKVDGVSYLDEPCNILLAHDSVHLGFEYENSFFEASEYFVRIILIDGNWEGYWNAGGRWATYVLDGLYYRDNCFLSEHLSTKICFGKGVDEVFSAEASESPDDLSQEGQIDPDEGWWGFTPEGCFDEPDNKERVAIGRFVLTNSGVEFGKGQYSVGFFNSICRFNDPIKRGQTILGDAECLFEGEIIKGMGFIFIESKFTRRVFLPDGMTSQLIKCPKLD